MISSMTAFARSQASGDWGAVTWELKSVNHRYFEVSFRLPETLRVFEPLIREQLAKKLSRGKIDVSAKYTLGAATTGQLQINDALLRQLVQLTKNIDQELGRPCECDALKILSWPGVLQDEAPDMQTLQQPLLAAMEEAVDGMVAMRRREGDAIKALLESRLQGIVQQVAIVRQLLPEIAVALRSQIVNRLQELQSAYDVDRLEQELVYLAQKSDVAEELDRLEAHIKETHRALASGEAVGRRLDFLMQEFNREANTLGSKSTDSRVTQAAVELKVLIEQLREQVQNVE